MTAPAPVRIGITLPSFRDDPDIPIAVAVAAEAAGVDGVFAYDHLFRVAGDGRMRPALECTTLLGAVAAETSRVTLGTLVARATFRPPATLGVALDTVQRVSGGRLIAAVGAGDSQSRLENESYGLGFESEAERVAALDATVTTLADRGYPVWVGGSASHVGAIAARTDGWNRWGADASRFACEAEHVRGLAAEAGRDPAALTLSWGGLVVLDATDERADAKAQRLGAGAGVLTGGPQRLAEELRAFADLEAEWLIIGPIDSSNPENAARLGELVIPALRGL
jgi:alkanesulfonate monooxygenase SsuD/methylene tetrahydromethanopterin reductase-like flavin-dependent oxidoreductase (luciferase family)